MWALGLFVAFFCLCIADTSKIAEAFAKDGFDTPFCITQDSNTGCYANSTSATNLRNGLPKKVFYLNGTFYSWGYNVAMLASSDLEVVITDFLRKIPLALIAPEYIASHQPWVIRELEKIIEYILSTESVKAFDYAQSQNVFSQDILEEMQGLVDGAKKANPQTKVTLDLLKTLNYGFDVITARVFSGHLLLDVMKEASGSLRSQLRANPKFYKEPALCNGVGVRNSFVKPGYSGFLGRDFQFATAGVLQDYLVMGIFKSGSEVSPAVRVFAPGFVGAFAAMNSNGFAMGVNTIRSSNSNITEVGINSLMMIRSTTTSTGTKSLADAVDHVASSQRGAPFMYPMCDVKGDCAVLEAGRWLPNGEIENPLDYVTKKLIRDKLVPDSPFIDQHKCTTQRNGVYIRYMNYSYPTAYFENYNPALWAKYARLPYNPKAMTDIGVFVYQNFTEDNTESKFISNRYFMPQVEDDSDLVIVTNFGIVPENRLIMMNGIDDFISTTTADALVWRYDMLLKLFTEAKAEKIDFDKMVYLMDFLEPSRSPGYWHEYLNATNPMSAVIEGTTSVFDMQNRVVRSHYGYYADEWVQVSLMNYL